MNIESEDKMSSHNKTKKEEDGSFDDNSDNELRMVQELQIGMLQMMKKFKVKK